MPTPVFFIKLRRESDNSTKNVILSFDFKRTSTLSRMFPSEHRIITKYYDKANEERLRIEEVMSEINNLNKLIIIKKKSLNLLKYRLDSIPLDDIKSIVKIKLRIDNANRVLYKLREELTELNRAYNSKSKFKKHKLVNVLARKVGLKRLYNTKVIIDRAIPTQFIINVINDKYVNELNHKFNSFTDTLISFKSILFELRNSGYTDRYLFIYPVFKDTVIKTYNPGLKRNVTFNEYPPLFNVFIKLTKEINMDANIRIVKDSTNEIFKPFKSRMSGVLMIDSSGRVIPINIKSVII